MNVLSLLSQELLSKNMFDKKLLLLAFLLYGVGLSLWGGAHSSLQPLQSSWKLIIGGGAAKHENDYLFYIVSLKVKRFCYFSCIEQGLGI